MKRRLALAGFAALALAVALWVARSSCPLATEVASAPLGDVSRARADPTRPSLNETASAPAIERRGLSTAKPELDELDPTNDSSSNDDSVAPGTVEGRVTGLDSPGNLLGRPSLPRLATAQDPTSLPTPISGARVDLFLKRAGELEELGAAQTDRDGNFSYVVPRIAARIDYQRNFCELVAIVHAPGFATSADARQLRFDRSDVRGLDFVLTRGIEVRGRAVDAQANPIGGAVLRELHADEQLAVSDSAGHFSFGYSSRPYPRLEIAAPDGDRARVDVDPNGAAEVDLGDVAIGVGPHLRGVVRHSDGTPARGIELMAVRIATDERSLDDERDAVRRQIDFFDDDSLLRCTTDSRGRFAIFPNEPGEFALASTSDVEAGRFRTDRDDLELVASGTWLQLRVVEESGRPLAGAEVELAEIDAHGAPSNSTHAVATGDDAVAEFRVAPNAKYRASIAADGAHLCEALFETGPERSVARATLAVVAYEQPARLHVSIAHPHDVAVHGFRAELRTLDSHTSVATFFGFECDEHGASPPLAPGSFELELAPYGDSNITAYLRRVGSRPTVVLESGKTRDVEVEFALGGRIALHVATPTDCSLAPSDVEQATIALTDLSGAACDAHWMTEGEHVRSAGAALLAGSADSAEVFEPGRYRLRVEAPHFAPVSVEFALFEGRTANVEVALETRD